MAVEVIFPRIDVGMSSATLVEWKKKEGDRVEKDEIIFIMETEKAAVEVPAPESGILSNISAKEGDVVLVGRVIAYVLQPGEKLENIPEPTHDTGTKVEEYQEPVGKAESTSGKTKIPEGIRISPLARRVAEEHGIDISSLKGSGPGGRIAKEDVLRALAERKTKTKAKANPEREITSSDKIIPLSPMRATIARRMSQSFQTAPHFWVTAEADATELIKLRQKLMVLIVNDSGNKLTLTDLLIKIVAKALQEHPNVNASWTDEGIRLLDEINVGIATDISDGLIVPVISHANEKTLAEIIALRADLVKRGRERKLSPGEIRGSTFTLNNVGALGIKCIDAIINPPESAILTVGSTMERPAVVQGEITVRPMMDLSLACDHRVLDGASGGRFLRRVKELIEEPMFLLL